MNYSSTLFAFILYLLPHVGVFAQVGAQAPPGPAIGGYDPIAYHILGEARRGDPEFALQWNGTTWWFISGEHRDRFRSDPDTYAPQYNGWCAYGAARGYAAETDPARAWSVIAGKLYLNWSAGVASRWKSRLQSEIEQADAHWPRIRKELAEGTASVARK